MNDPKRSPIFSPDPDDSITKLQMSLNSTLQCIADVFNLIPDDAPAITNKSQIDREEHFIVKEDIVRCADDISRWFEYANKSVSELGHLTLLRDSNGEKFLDKIRELNERNIKCNLQLKEIFIEFKETYDHLNNEINSYIGGLIKEMAETNNETDKMELMFGEMYDLYDS